MNAIFGTVITISMILLTVKAPESILSAFIAGGEKALNLSVKLVVIYAIWLGIFELANKSNLSDKFAKLLKPLNKKLFGSLPEKAEEYISLNMSANILGMSGATTPFGIKSIRELEKTKGTNYAVSMFFVINATSVQLIPSSVLALRSSLGSLQPSSIILPTVLATTLSTVIGVLLVKIFIKKS